MSSTRKTVWVVRRRETYREPYRTVYESPSKDATLAAFQGECRRELECDPTIETRDIDRRIPDLRWGGSATFERGHNKVKIRIFKSDRKL